MVSHKSSQVFPLPKSYKCFHSAEKTLVTWAKTKENKSVEMTLSFKPFVQITSTNISIPNLERTYGDKKSALC